MVAGGESWELTNLEDSAIEQVENTPEDDDDPADDKSGEVNEEEAGSDEDRDSGGEGTEEDDDDDEEEEEEDEEDPTDYQDVLREKCFEMSRCVALKEKFDICEARVNSRQKTEENCAEELLDFVGCVDKCVAKSLFSHLK